MRPLLPTAVALSLFALASCGSSDPKVLADEGSKALGSGEHALALEKFDKALDRMEPTSPDFLRVSMGRFQALARTNPERTKNEFLAFHATHGDKVKDVDFKLVIDELLKKGAISAATEIVGAAKKAFPDSPVVAQLVRSVGDAATHSKDAGAVSALRGMGYAGGSDEDGPAPAAPAKKP